MSRLLKNNLIPNISAVCSLDLTDTVPLSFGLNYHIIHTIFGTNIYNNRTFISKTKIYF